MSTNPLLSSSPTSSSPSSSTKYILITGCSDASLGSSLAKHFSRIPSFHVFATVRDISRATALSSLHSSNLTVLPLDVTSSASVAACQDAILKQTDGQLDYLLPFSGTEFLSPLLDVDIEKAKNLYEVNVWGVLRVIQAFEPALVKSKGCIVTPGSIDGALNPIWAGTYASSKAALSRLSQTLAAELKPLGVRVLTLHLGSVKTSLFTKPEAAMVLKEGSVYAGKGIEEQAWRERMEHMRQASEVDVLAREVVKVVMGGKEGVVWMGAFAGLVRVLTWFPGWIAEGIVNGPRGVRLISRG